MPIRLSISVGVSKAHDAVKSVTPLDRSEMRQVEGGTECEVNRGMNPEYPWIQQRSGLRGEQWEKGVLLCRTSGGGREIRSETNPEWGEDMEPELCCVTPDNNIKIKTRIGERLVSEQ